MSDAARSNAIRVIETPLVGGPLTQAALAGTTPEGWYSGAPIGADEWVARCRQVAKAQSPWLAKLAPALGAKGARLLERVSSGGIVVTTGQQAGLFGGPWYTWFKAMAARELAAELQRVTGIPAAPVFWAATDDADFLEAASTVIAGTAGAEELALHNAPPDGVPMSHALIGDEINAAMARIVAMAGQRDDVAPIRAMRTAFRSGSTIGNAYVELLRTLLEGTGVAVLDASHASVGEAARTTLADALRAGRDIHAALAQRTTALASEGFSAPVEIDRELSLVFAWEPGRDGLPRKRRLTLTESAASPPETRLSANVLLRPVVESRLMPTVAYVAGPGEIAYFAQVSAVAQSLGVSAPVAVPRWSGMIVPADVDATLSRFGATLDELRAPHALEQRLARAALPPSAQASLTQLRTAVDDAITGFDGLLTQAALEGARGQLVHRLNRIERRVLAAAKRKDADAFRAIAAARGTMFPLGKPQERALNAIPWLALYGAELGMAIRSACTAHAQRLVSGAAVTA
ncbi:MAG TPA: bacillithiol biosynthesis BshC [Gemmatimonadaceae bacterium]|nr:bacillithiol biosynthesis BshC [Gemmatimonadaceae bacterium]